MKLPQTLRRIAVLAALLALGACLWRPPPIPPLAGSDAAAVRDSGFTMNTDAAAPSDTGAPISDQEACDRAARMNDGSAPATVYNDGRLVTCGTAPMPDGGANSDAARDSSASDSSIDANNNDGGEDGSSSDASTDDAAAPDSASAPADGSVDDGG
ncbi:MAG: hypothetical protein JNK05_16055 [Myxococcales bacterium]|nr:hypothetical protein [Myxococcales bacterium]